MEWEIDLTMTSPPNVRGSGRQRKTSAPGTAKPSTKSGIERFTIASSQAIALDDATRGSSRSRSAQARDGDLPKLAALNQAYMKVPRRPG